MNLFVSRFRAISEKWLITLPSLAYCFFYLTGFFIEGKPEWEKYFLTAIGAIIGGISSSFLWTFVGSYIHRTAHLYGKTHLKGFYYGIFTSANSTSSLLGAFIITFGLTNLSHPLYFALISGVALAAFIFGFFFVKDLKKIENKMILNPLLNEPDSPVKKSSEK